jgi:hypothetical protein
MAYADLRPLGGEEAARQLADDPDKLVIPLPVFCLQFGLTEREMFGELRSGRLKSHGKRTEQGFESLVITGTSLIVWMANPATPKRLLEKVDRHWASKKRPN